MEESVYKRTGFANWEAFAISGISLEEVYFAASIWKGKLDGVEKPWLCWNVNNDWCYVQQCLVEHVGWTPVIGFDPRVGPPKNLTKNSILIDFNEGFGLPTLHPVFPLEFVWLYTKKLAFWHSDLIVRPFKMQLLANQFEALHSGCTIAVKPKMQVRHLFSPYKKRYWELAGCTTSEASKSQFDCGAGWWRHIERHPNCPPLEFEDRSKYFWDHGVGLRYWQKKYGGDVDLIPESFLSEGHCTQINNPKYIRVSPNNENKNLSQDLVANYRLDDVCTRLGVDKILSCYPIVGR